jgi:hypothetical protein
MGITFRNTKGSALTHTELDNNFREYFYSASVAGQTITFFKSQSLDPGTPFTIYSVFAATGSTYSATSDIDITGSLNVQGEVSATSFNTLIVSSSIIYKSGSSKFGDSQDDVHDFTGSLHLTGSLRVTGSVSSSLGFSGSFFGDGSGLTGTPMAAGVISGSVQVDHDQTTNFDANEHVDHTTVSITGTGGVTGGGSITTNRTLTLNTADAQFTSGVKSKMNADNVLSGSMDNTGPFQPTGSSHNITSDVEITGSLIVTNGATGSFSGSFFGDGSGLTGVGGGGGIFAQTGSSYNTTNDLEITGSLNVSVTGSFGRVNASVLSGSFVGDGSNLTGVGGGGIFASTGSFYNTTNNLEITGSLTTTGNVTVGGTLTELSAIRFKTDIQDYTAGLSEVSQVRPVRYTKKDTGRQEIGVIAEELNQILPEFVLRDPTGDPYSVAYPRLTVVLVGAVKELYQIVQTQQEEIDRLKNS